MTEVDFKQNVGARLAHAIETLGITHAAAAKNMGISPSKLGNWIRGDHYPNPYYLARFCDRYNISTEWIYRENYGALPQSVADVLWVAPRHLRRVHRRSVGASPPRADRLQS